MTSQEVTIIAPDETSTRGQITFYVLCLTRWYRDGAGNTVEEISIMPITGI